MLYTIVIMLIGAVCLQIFAYPLIGVFALSAETQGLCIRAIRIVTLGYLFVGANVAFQGIFQAFGNGVRSLIISLIRLMVVVLPLAYYLTTFPNAQDVIWWAFPIAEGIALLVALVFMKGVAKEKINVIPKKY